MKKITLLLFIAFLSIGCNSDNIGFDYIELKKNTIDSLSKKTSVPIDSEDVTNKSKTPTNLELIREDLNKYLNSSEYTERLNDLYFCSEELGVYNSTQYLTKGYYLNPYYTNTNAVKFSDLESLLSYRFQTSSNPNELDSHNVYISFEVLNADPASGFLNTTEANRVYNEFICQLEDQLNISFDSSSQRIEFNIYFTIDYYLCCTGSSCCNPIFTADGEAYF